MNIKDTDLENSLYHDCLFRLGIGSSDTTTYPFDPDFVRNANIWYRKVNSWIWRVTGTWEYDDSNFSDLPIATRTLVDGQQDYEIPSSAQKIDRVEVLDSDGNYRRLTPIDKSQIKSQSMSEYFETAGLPIKYDLIGRSIFLYPKPSSDNVTLAAGLKVYFSRDIDPFDPDDDDGSDVDHKREPGFVSNFHPLLSMGPALDYARVYMPDKVAQLASEIGQMKKNLEEFYSDRHRDMSARITPNKQNYT